MELITEIQKPWLKKIPAFLPGDVVDVHVRIVEGEKEKGKEKEREKDKGKEKERERIQVFNGTVIARKGHGLTETFTVRRIVDGEGVERTFLVHSPKIAAIKVRKRGKVRRAKLYYLRERTGKSTRVREIQGKGAKPSDEQPPKESGKEG